MSNPLISLISPCFIVSDVTRTIAFYRDQLGFEATFQEPPRAPFFAVINREGAQILVKSHGGVEPVPNNTRHPWLAWDAFVYSPDPDALATDFAARGATFTAPLQDTHDGLRGFTVTDPNGYVLFFGRTR